MGFPQDLGHRAGRSRTCQPKAATASTCPASRCPQFSSADRTARCVVETVRHPPDGRAGRLLLQLGDQTRRRVASRRRRTARPRPTISAGGTSSVHHYLARDPREMYFGLGERSGDARPRRPALPHDQSRRDGLRRRARPTRSTSTSRSTLTWQARGAARLRPLLRHAVRLHVRLRLRARQLSRPLSAASSPTTAISTTTSSPGPRSPRSRAASPG